MHEVIFPKATIKLHWPHELCGPCTLKEMKDVRCEGNEIDGYTCTKCGVVYPGRTQVVDGIVHDLRNDR